MKELVDGFSKGFRLNYTGPRIPTVCKNLISANQHAGKLLEKISSEISLGRIMGPFDEKPISTLRLSPVGVLPKTSGLWRMIIHLSYPRDNSVNDHIDESHCTVQYTSFDNIIRMISELGRGALLAKMDIKSAFRLLPVYPGDFDLLGFKFLGKYYIDKCLPMGCAISCSIFEKFSSFLHWLIEYRTKHSTLDHYLDDFIFAGPRDTPVCKDLMNGFTAISAELGIPIAKEKTMGPTSRIVVLGLEIDSINMIIRIPADKLQEISQLIVKALERHKLTCRELESLVGKLSFFCKAVRPGRAFLRRFYDIMKTVKKPHHYIRINSCLKEDFNMWLSILETFPGQAYFPDTTWTDNNVIQLFTDSAGSADLGCGAFFSGQWLFSHGP